MGKNRTSGDHHQLVVTNVMLDKAHQGGLKRLDCRQLQPFGYIIQCA
jgi:hypothetical protein